MAEDKDNRAVVVMEDADMAELASLDVHRAQKFLQLLTTHPFICTIFASDDRDKIVKIYTKGK